MKSGLDAADVKWKRADSLVRGLDYYRHTAFEFIPDQGSAAADALGSQSTILGGGRYDGLMESLGGTATPAVGWAAGIERLAMLVGEKSPEAGVAILPESDELEAKASATAALLRRGGVNCWTAFKQNPKKRGIKARTDGVNAALYVRATDDPDGEFKLTNVSDTAGEVNISERVISILGEDRFGG